MADEPFPEGWHSKKGTERQLLFRTSGEKRMLQEFWSSLWSKLCKSWFLPRYAVVTSEEIKKKPHTGVFSCPAFTRQRCGKAAALRYDDLRGTTRASLSPGLRSSVRFCHCGFLGLPMFFSAGSGGTPATTAPTLPPLPPTSSTTGTATRECQTRPF